MTSLIAWIGVDQRGISSMYFASDSRLTWNNLGAWDHGRKLFVAHQYPHLLGYCGDVIFPTHTLSQIIEMVDLGLLADAEGNVDSCLRRIVQILSCALETYPGSLKQAFDVVYATREGLGVGCRFHLRLISYDKSPTLRSEVINLPAKSGAVKILGTGQAIVMRNLSHWESSDVKETSRAVFSAFSDALKERADPSSGGPPQLVGLYRIGGGKTFGVVWNGRRYFYGTQVQGEESTQATQAIKWHNDLFEICDPLTLQRQQGAQPQPRPR